MMRKIRRFRYTALEYARGSVCLFLGWLASDQGVVRARLLCHLMVWFDDDDPKTDGDAKKIDSLKLGGAGKKKS